MNFKIISNWTLTLTALIFLVACEKEDFSPANAGQITAETFESAPLTTSKKKNKGKDKTDPVTVDPITYTGTYQVVSLINHPLYRFSFSTEGDLVLLESDPSVGNFGSDYFGFWTDPFAVVDGEATWVQGLSTISWTFEQLNSTQVRVVETHIQRPYLSGETTTTVTDLGIYELLP